MSFTKSPNWLVLSFLLFNYLLPGQTFSQNALTLQYDNDLFTQTDQYYSQGIFIGYETSHLKHFFLNHLLLNIPNPHTNPISNQRGFGIQHAVFTPTDLGVAQPLINDRPYAGYLLATYFQKQTDNQNQHSLFTQIHWGVIGRPAFSEGMQKTIHDVVGSEQPQGWDNQIESELLIGYQIRYTRSLLGSLQQSHLKVFGQANLSTLQTNLNVGTALVLCSPKQYRIQFKITGSSQVQWVGYNATLQGGIFNQNSIHTVASSNLSRWVSRHQLGIHFAFGSYHLGYTYHLISPEFNGGEAHRWGSILFKVGF